MNKADAMTMANALINEHLAGRGWVFEFDNAKKRFGQCNFGLKRITLSRAMVELNTEDDVRDTILHEIAHALAGFAHGHDNYWKLMAISIGAKPRRCYDSKTVKHVYNYEAMCPQCKRVHTKVRKPRGRSSCGACSKVRRFDESRLLVYKPVR